MLCNFPSLGISIRLWQDGHSMTAISGVAKVSGALSTGGLGIFLGRALGAPGGLGLAGTLEGGLAFAPAGPVMGLVLALPDGLTFRAPTAVNAAPSWSSSMPKGDDPFDADDDGDDEGSGSSSS